MKSIYLTFKKIKGIIFFTYLDIKRKINIRFKKPIFYVVGDSHTLCFQHEKFIIEHIGPATAYRLRFNDSSTKGKQKIINFINSIYVNKPINIIFVFGEIDVRIHINKVSKQNKKPVKDIILNTVKSYMIFLKYVKSKYPKINLYVFNILPQGNQKNIYNTPFYANRKKRLSIARLTNTYLKKYSTLNNFKFINIFEELIDKSGSINSDYVFDDVHFNRKIIPSILKQI